MNIITNKEVFSEENQAKMPKKIEKRRSRPRMSKPAGSAPTSANPSGEPNNNDAQNKTVFYQAARPRNNRTGSNFRPVDPARPANNQPTTPGGSPIPAALPGQAIDPRTLIRNRPPQAS